jgi:hypothetical protein
MKLFKPFGIAAVVALLALGGAAPALAVTNVNGGLPTSYVAAFAPVFGIQGVPHSGNMVLSVNGATITGTYTGTSVAPDFLNNRIVPVTGSIDQSDGHLQLFIGNALSLQGTMNNDGSISGTATLAGRLYEFVAAPGGARPG